MPAVSPSTSATMRVRYPSRAGMLGSIMRAIGDEGALIRHVQTIESAQGKTVREIDIEAWDSEHQKAVAEAVSAVPEVELLHVRDRTFELHLGGKISIANRVPVRDRDALARAYTPGVARVCKRVQDDLEAAYRLTIKGNMVAVVSDGSAVLGLGNIGPYGALPVMEGKAMLFKEFAGIDAFPLCLSTQDVDEIVETVIRVAPVFGGINLEDISAPRCFEVEARLKAALDIPVFHDDQHGTAVVVAAGLTNALQVTGRELADCRITVSGAGAAGMAVSKLLLAMGARHLVVCDSQGAIYDGRTAGMNPYKQWLAEHSNPDRLQGGLAAAVAGADVFIGVSGPNVLDPAAVRTMRPNPIVFALANPVPEVDPVAIADYAGVIATGRSDLPNQINNAIAFPGIFRGVLDSRAADVNQEMLLAAAAALAAQVPADALCEEYVIPSLFDSDLAQHVADAVMAAAERTGVARAMTCSLEELVR